MRQTNDLHHILKSLVHCTSLGDAEQLVKVLEAQHAFRWRAVGDRENNAGTIEIGSDPGLALVERVTNAIDAVIERAAESHLDGTSMPDTPREAVEVWFGLPDGDMRKIDIPTRQDLANRVVVGLMDGSSRRRPTVRIRDLGIGLSPEELPTTILSLGESNKVGKPYLAGAYGQGGSTALAFSRQGTLIASRSSRNVGADNDLVAVTFARHNELDYRRNINGRYEYLVGPDNSVASVSALECEFEPGTSVLHFNMEIEQYGQRMTQLTGSFWWLFQNSLFRPVLPIWLEELRPRELRSEKGKEIKKVDRRTVIGNFNRLNQQVEKAKESKVEYSDSVDVALHFDGTVSSFTANFWVLRADLEKSSSEVGSYVDVSNPIVFTQNGQMHGTESRSLISNRFHLPYLSKYLIVHVELDRVHPRVKRALFSSTRDRMRKVPAYQEVIESLSEALSEDDDLRDLNSIRQEQILSKYSSAERDKMRQRFADLMKQMSAGVDAKGSGKGGKGDGGRPSRPPHSRRKLDPLPTQEHPTYLKIANAASPVPLRVDRQAVIRLESDAPDSYVRDHVHARLTTGVDPGGLMNVRSSSDFRGGRARILVAPSERATPGDEGVLTVFLLTSDGGTLQSKVRFRVDSAVEAPESGEAARSSVKVPEPIPIHDHQWGDLGWSETDVAEVKQSDDDAKIYVNVDNRHIAALLRRGGYQEVGIKRMRSNFLLYVAYYAWAHHVAAREGLPEGGEEFERYQANEFDRLAQTVVFSIAAGGRLSQDS